jgi:hypothetical protein
MRNDEVTATRGSAAPTERRIEILRYFDVVVVAIATAPALALGAPALGYLIGAISWIAQRALAQVDRRLITQTVAPGNRLGLNLFEAFGRIWLLAGAIVAAGVIGGRADGLAAALTIFGAYSIAFAIKVIGGRPPAEPQAVSPARPQPASSPRSQAAAPARSSASPHGASR